MEKSSLGVVKGNPEGKESRGGIGPFASGKEGGGQKKE